MSRTAAITMFALAAALSACSGMSAKEHRMLSGGAIGAASGAVVSGVTGGSTVGGALIGGAAGTGLGYLYHRSRED
jgi:hypothetical protein